MKDRIFLINILKCYDPIRCNYGENNDKTSKRRYFLLPPKLADPAIFLHCTFSLVTFKIKKTTGKNTN